MVAVGVTVAGGVTVAVGVAVTVGVAVAVSVAVAAGVAVVLGVAVTVGVALDITSRIGKRVAAGGMVVSALATVNESAGVGGAKVVASGTNSCGG
jgi:hypothetical protein